MIVGVVSLIPTVDNFFAETLKPCCPFCTKMPEMSDLCYLRNTRICGTAVAVLLIEILLWHLIACMKTRTISEPSGPQALGFPGPKDSWEHWSTLASVPLGYPGPSAPQVPLIPGLSGPLVPPSHTISNP